MHLGACDYLLKPVDPDELEASVRRAMRQIETERKLEELAAAGADLALSGHTHNGQMFPGNLLIRLAWKNPAGVLQVGDMTSCVTQGAGVWGPAMRVGTDSEVMLLHVRFAP